MLWPTGARADCTSPAATAGTIEYFSTADEKVHRYCDGDNWTSWAGRTYTGIPAPTPAGSSDLPDLGDVDDALSPSQGHVLLYSGGVWTSGTGGAAALNDLTDVDTTGVSSGEVLLYSGGNWVPGTASGGGGGGGPATIVSGRYSTADSFNAGSWSYTSGTNAPGIYDGNTTTNVADMLQDVCAVELSSISHVFGITVYRSGTADLDVYTSADGVRWSGQHSLEGGTNPDTYYGIGSLPGVTLTDTFPLAKYIAISSNGSAQSCREIQVTATELGGGGSGDDLGDHTATQNILLGANYLSQTGSASKGLSFDGSDNASLSDGLTVGGTAALTGDLSPASIGADQDNYAPTGLATASVLRLTASGAYNITGLGGGIDGRIITLVNIGANAITLMDESASSTAVNRFALTGNVKLLTDQSAVLLYDATTQRWRAMAVYGSTLNDLTDVDTTGASSGNVLLYSGGNWVPGTASGGGGGGGGPATIVSARYSTGDVMSSMGYTGSWNYMSGTSAAGIYDGNTTTNVANILDDFCAVELSALSYVQQVTIYRSSTNDLNLFMSMDGIKWAYQSLLGSEANPEPYDGFGVAVLGVDATLTDAFPLAKYIAVASVGSESCREIQVTAIEAGGGGGGGGGDSLWSAGTGDDIYYNSGTPMVGIGTTDPTATLHVVGDIVFTGNATDISDIRLKENIEPVESALERMMRLEAISFTMKDDPLHRIEYGFSAQQMLEIYPALVRTADDADRTLSVNYLGMIALLTRGMQEQQGQIEKQEAQIAAQQGQIDELVRIQRYVLEYGTSAQRPALVPAVAQRIDDAPRPDCVSLVMQLTRHVEDGQTQIVALQARLDDLEQRCEALFVPSQEKTKE